MSWKTLVVTTGIAGLLAITPGCNKKDEAPAAPSAVQPAPSADVVAKEKAPTFTLPDLDGAQVSLEEAAKGKPVLLDFWATWCPTCRDAVPTLNALHKEYADKMTLLSIDVQEDKETVSKTAKQLGIAYRVLLDRDATVAKLYKLPGFPTFIILDKDLTIKHRVYTLDAAKSAMVKLLEEK